MWRMRLPKKCKLQGCFCPPGICSLAESHMGYVELLLRVFSLPIAQLVDENTL